MFWWRKLGLKCDFSSVLRQSTADSRDRLQCSYLGQVCKINLCPPKVLVSATDLPADMPSFDANTDSLFFQPSSDVIHQSGGLSSSGPVHGVLSLPPDRPDLRSPPLWLVAAPSLTAYFNCLLTKHLASHLLLLCFRGLTVLWRCGINSLLISA